MTETSARRGETVPQTNLGARAGTSLALVLEKQLRVTRNAAAGGIFHDDDGTQALHSPTRHERAGSI
jgi:hypothetical protein